MELSWNPNTKCTEKAQFSISTHPFFDALSFLLFSDASSLDTNLICHHLWLTIIIIAIIVIVIIMLSE